MFTNLRLFKIYRLKIVSVLVALLLVGGAHGAPIIKNDVEDLNIIISQFVGGQPNVLTILDLSGSMGRNFGGTEVGNWDSSDAFLRCQDHCDSKNNPNCTGGADTDPNFLNQRMLASHCAEEMAGTAVCGTANCGEDGKCDTQTEFNNLVACVSAKKPGFNPACTYDAVCGNNDGNCTEAAANCNNATKRENAAAALEAAAGLTQCMTAANCKLGTDRNPACDTINDYNRFKTCMQTLQAITANKVPACIGGTPNCQGAPTFGSSRLDIALDVFYSLLDADSSLSTKRCSDTGKLFDGVNTNISCSDYMNTPFRDVGVHVKGTGNGFKLPIIGGQQEGIIDELTDNDAKLLGLRLRPLTYSGASFAGCTDNNTFQLAQGGFAGASGLDLQNVWKFFRGSTPNGGTPLAYVLGLDDNNGNGSGGGNVINNDTLGVYKVELQTDPAVSCRPEFAIVITDGEDTCAGQCSVTSNSCNGGATTNANRRSSVQAVSNTRTYYARNSFQNRGNTFKKEVLTFVIGLGIRDDNAKRTLNAMALAGGTHTTGIIKHCDPSASSSCDPADPNPSPQDKTHILGTVDINTVLPSGNSFQVFKDLAIAKGIVTNPSGAQIQGCKTPVESGGSCTFQSTTVFDDNFFNTGAPFSSGTPLNGFAFFANDAQELAQALHDILQFIETFSTSGISPAAPQSSTSVALRDRIFLSILTPITTERLWQGRLGLYAFVDDPSNPGAKVVIRKPNSGDDLSNASTVQSLSIFASNGSLNDNAKQFFWEAGKGLAERDLSGNARRLFSVDITDSSTVDTVTVGTGVASIRYRGERATFDDNLSPALFGITNTDVTNPIPSFCTAGGIRDCTSSCAVVTSSTCQTCVKNCIRDKIVDFMSGNTGIEPVSDPMGQPTLGSKTDSSIGFGCPDPATGGGNLTTCSLRLGDIFHSTPVVVGSPSALFFDVGFQNFAQAFRNRTGVVYVGANDGFLHAFNAGDFQNASVSNSIKNPFTNKDETVPFFSPGDGTELFGFAPPSFLPDSLSPPPNQGDGSSPSGITPPDYRFGDFETFVTDDNEPERSFFDGSPLIADVFIDGYENGIANNAACTSTVSGPDGVIDLCGKEWHTVLISAFRNGGGAYTALDVTNVDRTQTNLKKISNGPDYPKHLWTGFDKNFGNVWSDPTIGRVRMKTRQAGNDIITDRWVMFVGGGLDPTDLDPTNGVTFGNAFYAIDIATGNIVFKYARDLTTAPGATVTDSRMVCDIPSKVGAFDLNSDGFIDLVYVGDTCGRLWRFDVSMPLVDNGNDVTKTGLRGTANITASWTGDLAFCANTNTECTKANNVPTNNRQPIFFAPTAVLDDLGRRHVIFTTGDRREPTNTGEFGKLYNFIDDFVPAFLAGGTAVASTVKTKNEGNFTTGQIVNIITQTGSGITNQFTTSVNGTTAGPITGNNGEFIVNFPNNVSTPNGEKGVGSPTVVNRVLVFATFAPNTNLTNVCTQSVGVGNVFALDYLSGQPALVRIPGAKNLLQGSSAQQNQASGRTVAQGMPTPAQLTFGARGSVVLTLAFTGSATAGGSQFLVWELPPFPSRTQTLFWEQIQ